MSARRTRKRLKQIERAGALVEFDVGRQDPRLEVRGCRIQVVGGRERSSRPVEPQEAVVAQVIVDIGDQHAEDDAPIKCMGVRLSLGAMFRENIDDFRVAATLAVSRAQQSCRATRACRA